MPLLPLIATSEKQKQPETTWQTFALLSSGPKQIKMPEVKKTTLLLDTICEYFK